MIEKHIHCGQFGGYQLSALNMRCMDSWLSKMPDWSLFIWNDSSLPKNEFTANASPINISNYMKYWTIYHFGGVFLDFDVEVLKPFDSSRDAFVGFQKVDDPNDCINTAVIGSAKGGAFPGECLARVERLGPSHAWPVELGCGIPTSILCAAGMKGINVEQEVGGVTVYSKERFYPWGYLEVPSKDKITDRTFSVHHWEGSWKQ